MARTVIRIVTLQSRAMETEHAMRQGNVRATPTMQDLRAVCAKSINMVLTAIPFVIRKLRAARMEIAILQGIVYVLAITKA
jgi:hypothetical protein